MLPCKNLKFYSLQRQNVKIFLIFNLKSGQRGIGRSNLVLYDLARKTKLPRASFESSALHHVKDVVTLASSALNYQKTYKPDPCK